MIVNKRIIPLCGKELFDEYLKYCQGQSDDYKVLEENFVEFYDNDSSDLKKIMFTYSSTGSSLITFLQEKICKQNEIIKSLKANIKDISKKSNNRYHAILNLEKQVKNLKNKVKIQNESPGLYKNLETKNFEQLCGLFDIDEEVLNLFGLLKFCCQTDFLKFLPSTLIITRNFNKSEELVNKMIEKYKKLDLVNCRKRRDKSFQMRLSEEEIFIVDINYLLKKQILDGMRFDRIVFYDERIKIIESPKSIKKEFSYKEYREIKLLTSGRYNNYNYYILNLGTHPTAYVEIPFYHKYYKKDYKEIDIEVHGGLTYSRDYLYISKNQKIEKSWFIGWDYAHCDDFVGYSLRFPKELQNGKKWTVEEIEKEVYNVCKQLKKIEKNKERCLNEK